MQYVFIASIRQLMLIHTPSKDDIQEKQNALIEQEMNVLQEESLCGIGKWRLIFNYILEDSNFTNSDLLGCNSWEIENG